MVLIPSVRKLIGTIDKIDKKTEGMIGRFQVITENLNRVAKATADLGEKMDRRFDEMNRGMKGSIEVIYG